MASSPTDSPRACWLAPLSLLVALFLGGCSATPKPPPSLELPATSAAATADLERWWEAFDDPQLSELIAEALANNLDLQAAIVRVDLARANFLLAQTSLYPSVNLGIDGARRRMTQVGSQPLPATATVISNSHAVGVQASYEVDLWGRYRNASAAARNELFATGYARETVRTAVAAETARAWYGLRTATAEVALLRQALQSRAETVALQQRLQEAGILGDYDLRRAEAERAAVAASLAQAERVASQYETALAAILGRSPRRVFEPALASEADGALLVTAPAIPDGLPADLLERRPDIRRAEALLAAADLRVAAARAQYFPALSLTASFGSESAALADLFSAPARVWAIGASLLQPLIGMQAIDANVQAETARREAAVVTYVQTVQTAFKETREALLAQHAARTVLSAQSERAEKLQAALAHAELRYRAGYSAYLEVLDAQRQLLHAQTQRIIAARDLRFALVDLARSLGGGWQYRASPLGPP